ncbi:hypothetical protein [Sandarakinorhabdus sp.]|uniref:hypothetical protein n=1 Tax=Sandarakinorhabdus sp. TaxID=1916663 RepID=UPI00286E56CA|nr:hypothetical protein [Sandarakinorhabdus sp.]
MVSLTRSLRLPLLAIGLIGLAGCESNPLLVKRSACPAIAIPTYAGDITVFKPGTAQDAGNIDMTATLTNVRDTCAETAASFASSITYDVVARRFDAGAARDVSVPVFVAVVQGGNLIDAKQTGTVTISFADGQTRGTGKGQATTTVSRTAAAVPPEILAKINRKRRPGELDAATDPMADPEIRAALRAASFEVLVGFQLDERSLAYNIAK